MSMSISLSLIAFAKAVQAFRSLVWGGGVLVLPFSKVVLRWPRIEMWRSSSLSIN
ncbi:hypothetical protein B0T18DRAFT_417151 [Schizothecium vesticola]|uniref:Uncharacterized protein n=1 Tax=Schizothecium vesticola TaxID=314040 RepID=A0AA40EID6_9PEZI|nr:hypothetical protein B0T18DRAFT_417151 [Schizothecium vesticola]